MFYLISKKDGLNGSEFLVNAMNLKSLEVMTANAEYEVIFTHRETNNTFNFEPRKMFNVGQVMEEITALPEVQYINPFICVTDIENINTVKESFGHDVDMIEKVSRILIKMSEISLVYEDDGSFVIATESKNFTIKESPQEVMELIEAKIKHQEQEVESARWKHNL